jgi:hypothetical protein
MDFDKISVINEDASSYYPIFSEFFLRLISLLWIY